MRRYSFYKFSLDAGFRGLWRFITKPLDKLLKIRTDQSDERIDPNCAKAQNLIKLQQSIQGTAVNGIPSIEGSYLAFGIPCLALILLVLVLDHFLHFPLVLTVILMATLGAVIMTALLTGGVVYARDENDLLQQYKELNETARRRWTIGSWLFFAVCLLACIAFLYLLQIDPTEILSDMQN